jgi:uncharacterized protein (TIGR00730 family)
MGTLAEAARDGGGRVVGVCLRQFVDLGIHDTAADELDVVDSLGRRKDEMIRRSDAFVCLPGGYGTLDEAVEVISQRQLGYHDKPLVLLDHDGFFTPLLGFFELLQAQRFAPPRMRGAYEVADTAEGAVTTIARLLAPPPPEAAGGDRSDATETDDESP